MISIKASMDFVKVRKIYINELSLRVWIYIKENKIYVLQKE
jgi:hypothetical protein